MAADAGPAGVPERLVDRPAADLVKLMTEQVNTLVRAEMELARLELSGKGKQAGIGAGLLGGAGGMAFFGAGVLVTTAILALALVLPAWLAALLVGLALLMMAGLLALIGRSRIQRAMPLVPEEAVRGLRTDLRTLRTAVTDRGRP
jgi:hypothetical protein